MAAAAPLAYLVTADASVVYELEDPETLVGRAETSDIVLRTSKSVSSAHARIVIAAAPRGGVAGARIVDSSLNGTFVNDVRVHRAAHALRSGDAVRFGYDVEVYRFYLPGHLPAELHGAAAAADDRENEGGVASVKAAAARASGPHGLGGPGSVPLRPMSGDRRRPSQAPLSRDIGGNSDSVHAAGRQTADEGVAANRRGRRSLSPPYSTSDAVPGPGGGVAVAVSPPPFAVDQHPDRMLSRQELAALRERSLGPAGAAATRRGSDSQLHLSPGPAAGLAPAARRAASAGPGANRGEFESRGVAAALVISAARHGANGGRACGDLEIESGESGEGGAAAARLRRRRQLAGLGGNSTAGVPSANSPSRSLGRGAALEVAATPGGSDRRSRDRKRASPQPYLRARSRSPPGGGGSGGSGPPQDNSPRGEGAEGQGSLQAHIAAARNLRADRHNHGAGPAISVAFPSATRSGVRASTAVPQDRGPPLRSNVPGLRENDCDSDVRSKGEGAAPATSSVVFAASEASENVAEGAALTRNQGDDRAKAGVGTLSGLKDCASSDHEGESERSGGSMASRASAGELISQSHSRLEGPLQAAEPSTLPLAGKGALAAAGVREHDQASGGRVRVPAAVHAPILESALGRASRDWGEDVRHEAAAPEIGRDSLDFGPRLQRSAAESVDAAAAVLQREPQGGSAHGIVAVELAVLKPREERGAAASGREPLLDRSLALSSVRGPRRSQQSQQSQIELEANDEGDAGVEASENQVAAPPPARQERVGCATTSAPALAALVILAPSAPGGTAFAEGRAAAAEAADARVPPTRADEGARERASALPLTAGVSALTRLPAQRAGPASRRAGAAEAAAAHADGQPQEHESTGLQTSVASFRGELFLAQALEVTRLRPRAHEDDTDKCGSAANNADNAPLLTALAPGGLAWDVEAEVVPLSPVDLGVVAEAVVSSIPLKAAAAAANLVNIAARPPAPVPPQLPQPVRLNGALSPSEKRALSLLDDAVAEPLSPLLARTAQRGRSRGHAPVTASAIENLSASLSLPASPEMSSSARLARGSGSAQMSPQARRIVVEALGEEGAEIVRLRNEVGALRSIAQELRATLSRTQQLPQHVVHPQPAPLNSGNGSQLSALLLQRGSPTAELARRGAGLALAILAAALRRAAVRKALADWSCAAVRVQQAREAARSRHFAEFQLEQAHARQQQQQQQQGGLQISIRPEDHALVISTSSAAAAPGLNASIASSSGFSVAGFPSAPPPLPSLQQQGQGQLLVTASPGRRNSGISVRVRTQEQLDGDVLLRRQREDEQALQREREAARLYAAFDDGVQTEVERRNGTHSRCMSPQRPVWEAEAGATLSTAASRSRTHAAISQRVALEAAVAEEAANSLLRAPLRSKSPAFLAQALQGLATQQQQGSQQQGQPQGLPQLLVMPSLRRSMELANAAKGLVPLAAGGDTISRAHGGSRPSSAGRAPLPQTRSSAQARSGDSARGGDISVTLVQPLSQQPAAPCDAGASSLAGSKVTLRVDAQGHLTLAPAVAAVPSLQDVLGRSAAAADATVQLLQQQPQQVLLNVPLGPAGGDGGGTDARSIAVQALLHTREEQVRRLMGAADEQIVRLAVAAAGLYGPADGSGNDDPSSGREAADASAAGRRGSLGVRGSVADLSKTRVRRPTPGVARQTGLQPLYREPDARGGGVPLGSFQAWRGGLGALGAGYLYDPGAARLAALRRQETAGVAAATSTGGASTTGGPSFAQKRRNAGTVTEEPLLEYATMLEARTAEREEAAASEAAAFDVLDPLGRFRDPAGPPRRTSVFQGAGFFASSGSAPGPSRGRPYATSGELSLDSFRVPQGSAARGLAIGFEASADPRDLPAPFGLQMRAARCSSVTSRRGAAAHFDLPLLERESRVGALVGADSTSAAAAMMRRAASVDAPPSPRRAPRAGVGAVSLPLRAWCLNDEIAMNARAAAR